MTQEEKIQDINARIASTSLTYPIFDMTSVDANAFSLMRHWQKAARKAGWSKEDIDTVLEECRSGDYDNLVSVLSDFSIPEEAEDDDEEEQEDEPNYGSNLYDDDDDHFIRTRYNS